jgi:hypothetical protein
MIRKTILALAATSAVAVAALTPTTASAWHHHHGWRGVGLGFAIAAPVIAAPVVTSCYRYQYVETRRGLRRMLVNMCAY